MIKVPVFYKENSKELETKKVLEHFLKVLDQDYDVSMQEIVTEMLAYTLRIISTDDEIEIDVDYNYRKSDDEISYDDYNEEEIEELDYVNDTLREFKEDVKNFKRDFKRGEGASYYTITDLREKMENMLEDFSEKKYSNQLAEVKKIKIEIDPMLDQADVLWAQSLIKESHGRIIHNVSSINSIISSIESASSVLEEKNVFSDDLKNLVRLEKERCAKYRAKKKMLDAEIAEKIGNTTKAYKLKAEAHALLVQDWRLMIKSDSVPDINSLLY